MPPDLNSIETWLFDLDNTLYSPHNSLFPQIHDRMNLYIMRHFGVDEEKASLLRQNYFHNYGTSLRGLMVEEKIEPDHFLDYVHDIDYSELESATALQACLQKIKGRKIIFTNADRRHGFRVLDRLGITPFFEDLFDIADGDYICKPHEEPYVRLLTKFEAQARTSCMIDDMEANLKPAANMGLTTIWMRHEAEWLRHKPGPIEHYPHCHYGTDDLVDFFEKNYGKNHDFI